MEHDDEIKGRIFTRRDAIKAAGAAGFAFLLPGASRAEESTAIAQQVNLVATPELTEGPFFEDLKLNRTNLIEGVRESVTKGHPVTLRLKVYELDGKVGRPLKGALVDIWSADAAGCYSGEPAGMNPENTVGQKWLRGYQVSDENGAVEFKTIWPGWYPGRTVHYHFKVRAHDEKRNRWYDFSSQLFFEDKQNDPVLAIGQYAKRGKSETPNARDGIYRARQADGTSVGSHLMLDVKEDPKLGTIASFSIAFDMDAAR